VLPGYPALDHKILKRTAAGALVAVLQKDGVRGYTAGRRGMGLRGERIGVSLARACSAILTGRKKAELASVKGSDPLISGLRGERIGVSWHGPAPLF
ncbi:MAG: hypothetical protein M0C28_17575, partial [Candidatus Moduliflexus flocculans]|nr:hypothetical protein [Candidatus Moduliflexus flocculans]